ncbi:MAG: hypothetical protein V3R72_12970, partial [Gammaproteobacteria bacterium]
MADPVRLGAEELENFRTSHGFTFSAAREPAAHMTPHAISRNAGQSMLRLPGDGLPQQHTVQRAHEVCLG